MKQKRCYLLLLGRAVALTTRGSTIISTNPWWHLLGVVPWSRKATHQVDWWRVTCTLTPSPALPTLTRTLPPWDSLDKTPAITAGSTQYLRPTFRIMGWYLTRYGMSISASLSEARTPEANTKEGCSLMWLTLNQKPQEKVHAKDLRSNPDWGAEVLVLYLQWLYPALRFGLSYHELESVSHGLLRQASSVPPSPLWLCSEGML
jgi:hypothetical protein